MPATLQLRLGSQELLRLASSVSATEPGLVTGAQVAAFIRECLQNLTPQHIALDASDYNEVLRINASKGASLIIQGGDSSMCLYMEGDLYFGKQTAGGYGTFYIDLPSIFSGGFDIYGGSAGQVLTKTKQGTAWADLPASPSSASGQSCYEDNAAPHTHAARATLPSGWYGVELLLHSSNGADCNYLLNAESISASHVCNVMGMAYGGTDNSSCPYATYNGTDWLDQSGFTASRPMASVLRMTFLYHHTGSSLSWPSESFRTPNGEWTTCSVRYTGIPEPQTFTAS
jgi:hypothetical protein